MCCSNVDESSKWIVIGLLRTSLVSVSFTGAVEKLITIASAHGLALVVVILMVRVRVPSDDCRVGLRVF